jgi:hypothetical protein
MSFLGHLRSRRRLALLASVALGGSERDATLLHVESCPACRKELEELGRVLDLVAADPVRSAEPLLPVGLVASRVEARLDELARAPRAPLPGRPVFALMGAAAAVLAIVGVLRYTGILEPPAPPVTPDSGEQVAVSEDALRRLERNLAREQAARYLGEAQDLLVTVAASPRNCDRETERVDVGAEAERSRELLRRRTLLLETDDVASARPVLEDVEQMLREVATLESCVRVRDVERLQEQMARRQLLMKMRLMQRELLG